MGSKSLQVLWKRYRSGCLKKLREGRSPTLEKLAYENDLSKSTLSRIERGEGNPSLTTLNQISESLEIPLKDLMDFG